MFCARQMSTFAARTGGPLPLLWSALAPLAVAVLASLSLLTPPSAMAQQAGGTQSGLPWASGVYVNGASAAALQAWRGRPFDVETLFFGIRTWTHMISSAAVLRTRLPNVPGRLVVALGMVPADHAGQLEACASGQFDPFIQALTAAMLANGARTAALAGKPIMIRLGWEANNTSGVGGYPWKVTGDGTSWRDCFRRWVDILNPVTDASTTPPTRDKNFQIVWNMANRGTFPHPIDNIWPGDAYVDVIGSQYYDRCPPLPQGNAAEWARRLSLRDAFGNPAGPLAWLNYARSKAKAYAVPEWGIGGPNDVCARPGTDNPYFIEKMHEFFRQNAADLAFESYFNDHGFADDSKGSHKLFAREPALPAPESPDYLAYVQRYNPNAAATYRALWGAALDPVPLLSVAALDAAKAEGGSGTTPFTFTVTRDGGLAAGASVAYRVVPGGIDPIEADDFAGARLPAGIVTLLAQQATATITLPVQGDRVHEGDEGFTVVLHDPSVNAQLGTTTAAGLIGNDDPVPPASLIIFAGEARRPEGNRGTTPFTFVVTVWATRVR